MDTDWLGDFVSVLKEGSFTKAAEQRNLSQPAFSRRIRALEEWVGAPLFERGTHKVTLTAAGEVFRHHAERMMNDLVGARASAAAASDLKRNSISIGCTHFLSSSFVPTWVQAITAEIKPPPSVRIVSIATSECAVGLNEGSLNFACFHYNEALHGMFDGVPIRFVDVSGDALVLVARKRVAAETVIPYVEYSEESAFKTLIEKENLTPANIAHVFKATMAQTVVKVVNDGVGAAWCLRSLVQRDLEAGVLLKIVEEEIALSIRIAMPRSRQNNASEAFWRATLDQARRP